MSYGANISDSYRLMLRATVHPAAPSPSHDRRPAWLSPTVSWRPTELLVAGVLPLGWVRGRHRRDTAIAAVPSTAMLRRGYRPFPPRVR
jgi:hypothetical protein